LNVLLIHQAFASPLDAGGTRHWEFAQHCLAASHGFTVVTSDLLYLTGKSRSQPTGTPGDGQPGGMRILHASTYRALHRSFIDRTVSYLSFMVTAAWRALRVGSVDVVMGTTPPIFQAVSAWVVAWYRRRPFLLEVRDLWPAFAIDMGVLRSRLLIWLARRLETFLYARADHLLVNSPAYRDDLLARGIPAAKVSLIPNGVDPAMFDPAAKGEAVRRQWQLEGKFLVVYAGALGMANDIPTILRAARRLEQRPEIHFLLVGDGKERANLETLAREWDLANVTFAGAQPKAAMKDYLAAADVCVATLMNIPMFRTTYPNKVFDYMAAGRPTILAIDGVIRAVIEAAEGGVFVEPGNDEAFARAVRRFADEPAEMVHMGAAARAYVAEHFDRRHHAGEFVRLLEDLAPSAARRGLRALPRCGRR